MQTFLPYPDFAESAKVLDNGRLGKQRLEAKQILQINLFRIDDGFEWIYCVNCGNIYYLPGQMNFNCPRCGSDDTTGRGKTNFIKIPWENHPACLMWRNYEYALALYGYEICTEWISRGFRDNQRGFFVDILLKNDSVRWDFHPVHLDINYYPEWYKNSLDLWKLCLSHQSNLLRRDWDYYIKYFGENIQDTTLPYYWPVKKENLHDASKSK